MKKRSLLFIIILILLLSCGIGFASSVTVKNLGTLTSESGNKGWSYAQGINEKEQIVGYSLNKSSASRAVLWQNSNI